MEKQMMMVSSMEEKTLLRITIEYRKEAAMPVTCEILP